MIVTGDDVMTKPGKLPRALFGALLLAVLPGAPTEAAGQSILGEWRVTYIDGWSKPFVTHPRIIFREDGNMNGNAGCNQFSGRYSFDGEVLTYPEGPGALTKKLCPGDRMKLERAFLDARRGSLRVVFKPGHVILLDQQGKARLRLEKAK